MKKMIFFVFSFDLKEIHDLFMKFYNDIDKNYNQKFDKTDLIQCFETFAKDEMLGIQNMKIVIDMIIKQKNFLRNFMSLFNEG